MLNKPLPSGFVHRAYVLGRLARVATLFPLKVPAFFAVKMAVGLSIMELSARHLSVGDFAVFSQFFVFAGLAQPARDRRRPEWADPAVIETLFVLTAPVTPTSLYCCKSPS